MKPAKPSTRKPPQRAGRPRNAAGDQRQRLLDAALQLFSQRGIAATPLAAIARTAKVTPAMLHYYFGTRDRLLDALVEERLMPITAALATLVSDQRKPEAVMRNLVDAIFDSLIANPWLPPLWVHEVLREGGLLRERLVLRIGVNLAPVLRDYFSKAQKRGALTRELDPRLLVVSLIGLTVFPFAAAPIWRRLLAADDVSIEQLRQHTLALLENGLGGLHAKTR